MLITSRHHREKDTLDNLRLMLPSNIFKFSNRLIINTSQSTSQEGSHIPLVWLVRNIAQVVGASNSVLVDPGTIPHFKNHTNHPLCPSLKYFIFSFVLILQINQGTKHQVLDIMVIISLCDQDHRLSR